MGKHISETLADYLENETEFLYPLFHIHDIGHQVKNAQASLERGTHFDGTNIYDATDLTLTLSRRQTGFAVCASRALRSRSRKTGSRAFLVDSFAKRGCI